MGAAARATSPFEVLTLGDLEVRAAGCLLPLPPSRKTRALLAYLALTGRAQTRQRLCDLLWDGPDDPRAALRWSLTKLRPLVGDRLATEKDLVQLDLGAGELDLSRARALLARGGSAPPSPDDLRGAVGLFRGELLEGLELPDCFGFQEWCVAQREAARRLRLELLDALVAQLEDEPEEALVHARARLAADPHSEPGHVAVVRLLGRLRRGREGLAQYDACRRILGAVGARPSAELERARLALTAQAPDATSVRPERGEPDGLAETGPPLADVALPARGSTAPRRASEASPASPLVGRHRERSELAELLKRVTSTGQRHALLLLGEQGIGKSRLLDEAVALARAAGFLALSGRAFEAETLRPYGPWIDALRGAPLSALPELQRTELAPLLPELGAPRAATTDQLRLFDAVVRALLTLAGQAPVLVALDDLQWLDAASAGLLHYALRALDGGPVLLAGAARPGELADNPPALRAARDLGRAERALRLELPPLPAQEVAALVRAVAPSVDPARVHAESEGNPLFALVVARALGGGAAAWQSVDALVGERLGDLTGTAREVVDWAAALGRVVPADRLERVTGLAPAELLAALTDLEHRGLLRPGGEAGWDFTHDLFRQAAYRAISEPRRRMLHRQIARTLAPLPDPDGALAGEIAQHAALGDDADLAAHAAVAAGSRAARLFATSEARDIVMGHGLPFAARLPTPRRIAVTLALLRVLVDVSRTVGGDVRLVEQLEALIEEARREGLQAEVAAGYAILSHAHYARRDLAHTTAAMDDGMAALDRVPAVDAAEAMAETAGCLAILERELPRARMLLAEARRCAVTTDRAAVYLELGTGIIQALEGAHQEASASLERALRLAPKGAPWEECVILAHLGFLDLERGRPERVPERTARIRAAAPRVADEGALVLAEALELASRRAAGEPVAEPALEAALARLEADARAHFARLACLVAEADLAAGHLAPACARLERAARAASAVSRSSLVVLSRALLARCELARGDAASARAHLDAGRRELGLDVPVARALRILEEVATALGSHATSLESPPPH